MFISIVYINPSGDNRSNTDYINEKTFKGGKDKKHNCAIFEINIFPFCLTLLVFSATCPVN